MTMFIRPVRPEDSANFTSWSTKYSYPSSDTLTFCAFKKDKIIAYLPIENRSFVSCQVLDTLVKNPEATNLEIAEALRELIRFAVTLGYLKHSEEIYFIGDHPETNKIAERIFEKVEYPVYRLSIKGLE